MLDVGIVCWKWWLKSSKVCSVFEIGQILVIFWVYFKAGRCLVGV